MTVRIRAIFLAALSALTLGVLVAPAAQADPLSLLPGSCGNEPASQPFAQWGDRSSYALVAGGSFEAGTVPWLLSGGAKQEMTFKYFLRRHQLPSQVWYKAYPGLTTADLARNTRIREGLEDQTMTEAEARRWLALI